MSNNSRNELAEVLIAAEEQGWTVDRTAKSHYRLVPPGPGDIVICSSSPRSSKRERAQTLSRMRRSGFIWPPRGGSSR